MNNEKIMIAMNHIKMNRVILQKWANYLFLITYTFHLIIRNSNKPLQNKNHMLSQDIRPLFILDCFAKLFFVYECIALTSKILL